MLCLVFYNLCSFLIWSRYDLEPSGASCTIAWWYNDAGYVTYVMAVFVVCFLLPIGVMVYCYARVIAFVRMVGDGGRQENLEWTNEKEIVKVIIYILIKHTSMLMSS